MINAQQKGKRFELQIAKLLNEKFGANVKRTPNSGGLSIKGDIMDTQGILSEFHFELKNQEKLNIWKALQQARNDKRIGKIPLVIFTKNHEKDYAALELDDLLNLILEVAEYREIAGR